MLRCILETSGAGFGIYMYEAGKARDLEPCPLSPEFVQLLDTYDEQEFPDGVEEGLRTSNAYVLSQCPLEVVSPLVVDCVEDPVAVSPGQVFSALTVGELFLLAIERGFALTISLEPPAK